MAKIRRFIQVVCSNIIILSLGLSASQPQSVSAQSKDEVKHQIDSITDSLDCIPYDPVLLEDESFLKSLPPECVKAYKKSSRNADITTGRPDVLPMAVGGPNNFGYTYDDSVTYSWISASINSGLTGDDEFSGPLNIGFNFPFYGIKQSQLYVSTNGLITFGAGSQEYYYPNIPDTLSPNDLIAAFWHDLAVGSPYNSGSVRYSQAGVAPNRYFVVEWRNVTSRSDTSSPFSFEVILHENGDIVVQYQSLTPSLIGATVGIENSQGVDGLEYGLGLSALKAIRFYYPTAITARLLVSPFNGGEFAPINGHTDFTINIANTGSMGVDTYDLSASSTWPVTLYASNGTTPLTDTDADTVIDTGLIPQGTSTNIIARFSTPGGAQIGDDNTGTITITSSLDVSKTKTTYLFASIPAGFASIFQDQADGAMSFMTVNSAGTGTYKATADGYFGTNPAVTELAGGKYLYAWNNSYSNGSYNLIDLEYAVLGPTGSLLVPGDQIDKQLQCYDAGLGLCTIHCTGAKWHNWIGLVSPS